MFTVSQWLVRKKILGIAHVIRSYFMKVIYYMLLLQRSDILQLHITQSKK